MIQPLQVLAVGLFLGLSGLAVELARGDIAASDINLLGERINFLEPVSRGVVRNYAETGVYSKVKDSCRSNILKNAMIVQLAALDEIDVKTEAVLWKTALESTMDLAQHIERCDPGYSDAWLRDAMIGNALGKDPKYVIDRIGMSLNLNPNNQSEIGARLSFLFALPPAIALTAEPLIEQDLSTVLLHFNVKLAKPLLSALPSHLKPALDAVASIVPPDRLMELGLK